MRHIYHHRPHLRRRLRRRFRGGGRLLDLVGLAALGYSLLDKYQREGQRRTADVTVDVRPQDWQRG
ncbi:MAG: hypothetical protein SVT56_02445 [Chloroflexota bacterium]|jgi:hypothetical protein|nr:hypothetical protein [Chloroflexota bacterium]